MPVDCSAISIIVVLDMDDQFIAPACFDQWPGIRFVEDLAAGLLKTIRIDLRNSEYAAKLTFLFGFNIP